ncbi:hypothetical protein HDU76_013656 [Blyttiomyces sp. JEL0837]|nr:hypothetical protein HDU76_013656 [Blyttiomyces sp. JEL0837]
MGCGASKSIESQVVETTSPPPLNGTSTGPTLVAPVADTATSAFTNQTINPTKLELSTTTAIPTSDVLKTNIVGCGELTGTLAVSGNDGNGKENGVGSSEVGVGVRNGSGGSKKGDRVVLVETNGVRDDSKMMKVPSLSRTVVPSIPSDAQFSKAVAFEIPLDEELKSRPHQLESTTTGNVRGSLPKLALSQQDIAEKLANTEARWKDLEQARESRKQRRRGDKPELTSPAKRASTADPAALKRRLLEKEAHAAQNRLREIEKLQSKLAKQEEHAKRVKDRKKALGRLSNENLNLSWGGEDDLDGATAAAAAAGDKFDVDSGKGSSAASLSNGSRSGSGRSTGTVDIGDHMGPIGVV